MDIAEYNQRAWNAEVDRGNPWTVPVDADTIARARVGDWSIVLTPSIPTPREWFPSTLAETKILCLAGSGGQQAPVLAAAGATVTVLDNSDAQLARDAEVAEREGLSIELAQGDMRDLSRFEDQTFDLIFHPCSNGFVPDVNPVWREAFRVLKPGGSLLSGFTNPIRHIFDYKEELAGNLVVRHSIPYADETSLRPEELAEFVDGLEPIEFGHTLDDQIGGQLAAGFLLSGFFEDRYPEGSDDPLSGHICSFIATRALRPMSNGGSQ